MADVDAVEKRLTFAQGSSPLHQAIRHRKTLRLGNRADPFQDCELQHQVSTRIFRFLMDRQWETVVQTKFPRRAWEMTQGLGLYAIMMLQITVGMEDDWELFEHRRTEPPTERLETLSQIQSAGVRVGANGEPFIPGYHTTRQFRDMMKRLRSMGIRRFNTYNLHLNDWVAKNLCDLGLDIERIWYMNQDAQWRRILRRLLDIAEQYDIILGCPDFVNSGWSHKQKCNTCCGLDVSNPCTFNAHHFKLAIQEGRAPMDEWDGVGDYDEGAAIVDGTARDMYTMKDVVK